MKKYLNIILITAASILWAFIFYHIIEQDSDAELNVTRTIQPVFSDKIVAKSDSLYPVNEQRDPFQNRFNFIPPKKVIKNNIKSKSPDSPSEQLPDIKLLGVVLDAKGAVAMISFPDKSVKFLRERDKVFDIELLTIQKNEISIKLGNYIHTLRLQ